ncbi:MAG: glycosyltransferase family 9 protein [Bacteroidota bacterium]|nr:glycosyltransferase family 9 protein [Bacteroidota bacterium]
MQDVRSILVCRRHNHVGDMLCSLPLYAALRRHWPRARITLLATPTRYPVPLRALNPFLDDLMYHTKGSVRTVVENHLDLRRRKFDVAFVPSTVALSRSSHLAAFLSGAGLRVGVSSIDGVENPSQRFLNCATDVHWVHERVHQMDRNLEIARAAGCMLDAEEMARLHIPIDARAEEEAARCLQLLPGDDAVIGVHPGAGKKENVWPTQRYFSVVQRLHRAYGVRVLITAGVLDRDEVSLLTALCTAHAIPFHVLQDAPVPLLSAVLRRLHLYLCNDTGTMHVAAFSGCPTVSIFGPTHAWEWAPRGGQHRCIISDDGEIESVDTEAVYEAGKALLEGAGCLDDGAAMQC